MNYEEIQDRLNIIDKDATIQNLIAQANARYILLNTAENRKDFPPYTIKDDNLNILAFYYLNLGCELFENENFDEAIAPLEKGASILEFVHSSESNKSLASNYYGLIGSLAYYVGFQYSKSFILIKKFESSSIIAKLIHQFLVRDFKSLTVEVNSLLIDKTYQDEFIVDIESVSDGQSKIFEITIAKVLDGFLKYFYSGNDEILIQAKQRLKSLKEISELESDPGIWWVVRLLLLISEGFNEASLWNSLKNHFDINNENIRGYIQSLVYMPERGIFELFITQRKCLHKVLNEQNGCIVSIPTSSGKTRIAELAILKCMTDDPSNKILYIAPFRSLAFEVENTLEPVLYNANISVSHLYGGSLYSKLDEKIIDESSVIIATPEKAKAILRGNSELIEEIKLVIIDEGHLLGPNKRLIVNEVFYEEFRFYMNQNDGKFLLLSAVLPNSEDLALWLTQSDETVYRNKWRPSDERLGILEWTGSYVNLNWVSQDEERPSYNKRFIVAEPQPLIGRQRTIRYLPGNKNDAVASTAFRFTAFGSVLIFVGLKSSVFVMAEAYYKCLGDNPPDHSWKSTSDWRAFELASLETYGEGENHWLDFARKGILCHNADLHADVRLPLERLMRGDKPLVIIATSTLGQGVNLGVSTVIFSTCYQAGTPITPRDFWNIAGRAGRAFVDHEGKILVALETTGLSSRQINTRTRQIKDLYFNKDNIDFANSGILFLISVLKNNAEKNDINFDLLLELISENKTKEIGDEADDVDEALNWIDDTLLSLQLLNDNSEEPDFSWIESFFRRSLAYIQSRDNKHLNGEQVIGFFKARIEGIVSKVGHDRQKWNSVVKSGLPLDTNLIIEEQLPSLIDLITNTLEAEITIDLKIDLLSRIELLLKDLPAITEDDISYESVNLDEIRRTWINGVPLAEIFKLDNSTPIITQLYTFKLPWILNGISKKMRNLELDEIAEVLEELSILLETGLPSLKKVKIYQAGIRSRYAANELGELFEDDLWDKTILEYKKDLVLNADSYKILVSENTGEWLDLLKRVSTKKINKNKTVSNFKFGLIHEKTESLLARKINGVQYLLSPDLSVIEDVSKSDVDFSSISDIIGIEFKYNFLEKVWEIKNNNPYFQLVD